MNKLFAACTYLLHNTSLRTLSALRINHMLFLADSESFLRHNTSLTGKVWHCNVGLMLKNDISSYLNSSKFFEMDDKNIKISGLYEYDFSISALNDEDKLILDDIIKQTDPLYFDDIAILVRSSHPFNKKTIYTKMDLSVENT